MFDALIQNVGEVVYTQPELALVAVFVGGLLTASNPCVLVMIPLMMGLTVGTREEGVSAGRSFVFSLVFVLGLSLTFVALGMAAALAGSVYGEVSGAWNWLVAVVCVVMGLHMMGVIEVPIPSFAQARPARRDLVGALGLGLLFGVVSAPCAAPILVVLLTYLATSGSSVSYGGSLLLSYALGHSALVLIAGTSMGAARSLLESKRASRVLRVARQGAGVVVILVGFFFAYEAW